VHRTIVLIRCPDQPGIIAKTSRLIFDLGGNILRSDQYTTDPANGSFFMRVEFAHSDDSNTADFDAQLTALASEFGGTIETYAAEKRMRMAIAVSKYDHCLLDLLYRVRIGELPATVTTVVSNHDDLRPVAESHGVPFCHFPITPDTKAQQEQQFIETIKEGSDFLVLARYMQVLSNKFLAGYGKDVINIHHSFLPSFKGANPYRQAYERGVKLIGATAHYATQDLDEGPIIEQAVERVSHWDDVESLKSKGRHLEQIALARAVKAHIEHRVIRLSRRTVIFE
jgi:formyltetrahydrofolate deformylase